MSIGQQNVRVYVRHIWPFRSNRFVLPEKDASTVKQLRAKIVSNCDNFNAAYHLRESDTTPKGKLLTPASPSPSPHTHTYNGYM